MNQQSSTVDDLLEQLTTAGIKLWSENGELRYRAPKGTLTPAWKQQIKQHKAAILTSLTPADTKTQLNLSGFFAQPTLAQLQQVVKAPNHTQGSVSIGQRATTMELAAEAESIFDLDIPSSLERSPNQPSAILLTGATGFLGIYLLYELLVQTEADIYCLVRAADPTNAQQRLQQKLQDYHLLQDDFSGRIMPLVGDLAQPQLGLSPAQHEQLCQVIDVIYHNGALVNFVYSYTALKAANVLGTKAILAIASTSKIKAVHYISTIGVFLSANDGDQIIYESDSIDTGSTLEGGYAQSKWVAEKLVSLAGKKGLPVTIYRPGTITGHSSTGISSTQDWLSLMLGSCLHLGMMPQMETTIAFTPVDYVSQGIVCLANLENSSPTNNNYYHLVSPYSCPWNQLPDLIKSLGYDLEQVSFEQWLAAINLIEGESTTTSLKSLLPSLQSHGNSGDVQFDSQNAARQLGVHGIQCTDSPRQLLESQLNYFQQQELIIS